MAEQIEIKEELVAVPGGSVFVKSWTPTKSQRKNQKAPLILFHDSLGCVEMWRDFPKKLCDILQRKVIAYDRLGFGRSSARVEPPSARFIKEEAEVYLPALLLALGLDRFTVFGHSVGGAMAIEVAGRFHDRCLGVVSESTQAFVEDQTRKGIQQARENFKAPEEFKRLEKYHGKKTQWVLDAWIKVWLSDDFSNWSLKDALLKMKCPTLVIHGENDEYGSNAFPNLICQLAGGTTEKQILEKVGHNPHRENPDLIQYLTKKFLSKVD